MKTEEGSLNCFLSREKQGKVLGKGGFCYRVYYYHLLQSPSCDDTNLVLDVPLAELVVCVLLGGGRGGVRRMAEAHAAQVALRLRRAGHAACDAASGAPGATLAGALCPGAAAVGASLAGAAAGGGHVLPAMEAEAAVQAEPAPLALGRQLGHAAGRARPLSATDLVGGRSRLARALPEDDSPPALFSLALLPLLVPQGRRGRQQPLVFESLGALFGESLSHDVVWTRLVVAHSWTLLLLMGGLDLRL